LAKGSPVEVNLSLGNKFVVEDFRGRPIAEVEARLEELGVDYDVARVASDLPEGTVVDQTPAPGVTRPIGTIVHLQVSTGEPSAVEAP
ncbi:MAG: PASTA domain-containing protein, partial [Firmicutes bacterium]|nr:PASTA domain-containing protein [Bacillota bacterium]